MVEKTRYSVTLREQFTHGFNELVERGLCVDPQDAMRSALKLYFEKHGVEGFISIREDPKKMISEAIEMLEEMLRRIQDG